MCHLALYNQVGIVLNFLAAETAKNFVICGLGRKHD